MRRLYAEYKRDPESLGPLLGEERRRVQLERLDAHLDELRQWRDAIEATPAQPIVARSVGEMRSRLDFDDDDARRVLARLPGARRDASGMRRRFNAINEEVCKFFESL